jgi:pyruvate,orthophosphate dikinase
MRLFAPFETSTISVQLGGRVVMALQKDVLIRDFRVRGNYFNQRTLISKRAFHHLKKHELQPGSPGYSAPEVAIELENGSSSNLVVSEIDIPFLCDTDFETARHYLSLIIRARDGNSPAADELLDAARNHPLFTQVNCDVPQESLYAVPCTSPNPHSGEEISQKGSILLRLSQEGYPVPDFAVMTAQAYLDREQRLDQHFSEAISQLQALTMQRLGDSLNPLVFAIRCATPRYIPGVMETYLNVGITEAALPGLERRYGARVAQRMFLNNLRNLSLLLGQKPELPGATRDLTSAQISSYIDRLLTSIGKRDRRLFEDALHQSMFFVRQAYEQFEENRELVLTLGRGQQYCPSLILQKMVCTVRDESAYAGVVCSRHTQTGVGVELQTAHDIFGEEIMTGTTEVQSRTFRNREEIREAFPAVYHFAPHLSELEREFESPVTIEFAVEANNRFQWFGLLQLNETGMSGRAALAATIDLHKSGTVSRKRVTELIRPYHIKQLSSDSIDEDSFSVLSSFCTGVPVLPRSAVSARVCFSAEAALKLKGEGEKVCLCKETFVPTDTVVMREMDAILSLTSVAIHVVTICQSLGIPALLSLEKDGVRLQGECLVNPAGGVLKEGDWITISSRRRTVYEGKARYTAARLLRYMQGETVDFSPGEQAVFDSIAYNYRFYQQLIKGLTLGNISSLDEITRLVNVELRASPDEATTLVNSWFDEREQVYVDDVFKSDIGDHLAQSRVFDLLTLDRKIRFFKRALAKCSRDRISGYEAGAFMLGRFLSSRYPVRFWKSFTPGEVALLINEWVLFEKYIQLLHDMGERKLLQARKKILQEGLDPLRLHSANVKGLISIKLAGVSLAEAQRAVQDWNDPQSNRVIELLQQPYSEFFDFQKPWSFAELEKICREDSIPVPRPSDV